MKYRKNQIVTCFGIMVKITRCQKKDSITGGPVYDAEAVKPDKEGYFMTYTRVPEGFINL